MFDLFKRQNKDKDKMSFEDRNGEQMTFVSDENNTMNDAMQYARDHIHVFLEALENPQLGDEAFGVKAPIEDRGQVEHFWISDISYNNGTFDGVIANDAQIVSNVSAGDPYQITKDQISDWMFMRDGLMHGNYTMRAMLAEMPEPQASQYRAMLAD